MMKSNGWCPVKPGQTGRWIRQSVISVSRPAGPENPPEAVHHLIVLSAYTISMSLARNIRTVTGYRNAHNGANALVRKILTQPGDIDPTVPGHLDITLDPLPTGRERTAAAEL